MNKKSWESLYGFIPTFQASFTLLILVFLILSFARISNVLSLLFFFIKKLHILMSMTLSFTSLLPIWEVLFEIQLNSLRVTICRFYLTKNNTVGSWFLDRAQYNKFVESGSKSWALIRRWLVLGGEKHTESGGPTS